MFIAVGSPSVMNITRSARGPSSFATFTSLKASSQLVQPFGLYPVLRYGSKMLPIEPVPFLPSGSTFPVTVV